LPRLGISSTPIASGSISGALVLGGISFADVSDVSFGGIPCQSFFVDNDTQITVVTPSVRRAGLYPITTNAPNHPSVPFSFEFTD
jgi:hypothetical protein